MVTSVRDVLRGKDYLSPRISKDAVDALRWQHKKLVEETEKLTQRQREVLQLLAEGKSMQEIASASGAAKGAGKAGFAVKKPGSEDIDAWIGTNWEAAAEEPLFKFGLLSNLPVFAGLTAAEFELITSVAQSKYISDGGIIFKEGSPIREVAMVLSGSVEMTNVGWNGNELTLEIIGPGALVEYRPAPAPAITGQLRRSRPAGYWYGIWESFSNC